MAEDALVESLLPELLWRFRVGGHRGSFWLQACADGPWNGHPLPLSSLPPGRKEGGSQKH